MTRTRTATTASRLRTKENSGVDHFAIRRASSTIVRTGSVRKDHAFAFDVRTGQHGISEVCSTLDSTFPTSNASVLVDMEEDVKKRVEKEIGKEAARFLLRSTAATIVG